MSAPAKATTDATESESGEKTRIGKTAYTAIGVLSGAIAFVFVPILFGLLSVFCGVQVFRRYSEYQGLAIMVWGGFGLFVGLILGLLYL